MEKKKSSIVHKIIFLTSSDHPEDDAKDEESQQAELNCCGEIDQRFCDTVTQVTCSMEKDYKGWIFDIYDFTRVFVTKEEEEEDKMMRESGEKNTVNELRFGTVGELREI